MKDFELNERIFEVIRLEILRSTFKKTLALAMAGAFALTMPLTVEAKRVHDPKVDTKVERRYQDSRNRTINLTEEQRRTVEENRARIQARIDAILHPDQTAEMPTAATPTDDEWTDDIEFTVPTTLSSMDTSILGTPMASQNQCVRYLLMNNPNPNIAVSAEEIVQLYYEEGAREGIRPDVALCQAFKETGFFRYGGTVTPDQNNYCGLGTTSAVVKGSYFPNPQIGVRAHIQHLLAYSSTRRPSTAIVDPRYSIVRKAYGKRTLGNWQDLNGRWAVPGKEYGQQILSMFNAMLRQ